MNHGIVAVDLALEDQVVFGGVFVIKTVIGLGGHLACCIQWRLLNKILHAVDCSLLIHEL